MSARTLGYFCLLLLSAVTGFLLTRTLFGADVSADGRTQSPPREARPFLVDDLDSPEPMRYMVEWTDRGIVFHHPDERGEVAGELFIPVGGSIVLEFHGTEDREFAIPAFGIRRPLRADLYATVLFEVKEPGSHEILHRRSAEESYELAGYVRAGRW